MAIAFTLLNAMKRNIAKIALCIIKNLIIAYLHARIITRHLSWALLFKHSKRKQVQTLNFYFKVNNMAKKKEVWKVYEDIKHPSDMLHNLVKFSQILQIFVFLETIKMKETHFAPEVNFVLNNMALTCVKYAITKLLNIIWFIRPSLNSILNQIRQNKLTIAFIKAEK